MKRADRLKAFKCFYRKTYKQSLCLFIEMTGDFLNAEDFSERVYSDVYRYYLKAKLPDEIAAEERRKKSIKHFLESYLQKQRKGKEKEGFEANGFDVDAFLERSLGLEEAGVEKQMLRQEILSYISKKPLLQRRLFAYVFYLGMTIEQAADQLKISAGSARDALGGVVAELEEQLLLDFEQGAEE